MPGEVGRLFGGALDCLTPLQVILIGRFQDGLHRCFDLAQRYRVLRERHRAGPRSFAREVAFDVDPLAVGGMGIWYKTNMRIIIVSVILWLAAGSAWTQEDTTPKKRLRTPAAATGFVGGESHDSYAIRAGKGQMMSVQISWQRTAGNRAQFMVSESADFFAGAPVTFGRESGQGTHWSAKVPKTGDYYIYVVAHPTAHYTLRVTVK